MDGKSIAVWWAFCSLMKDAGFFRDAMDDAGAISMELVVSQSRQYIVGWTAVPVATTVMLLGWSGICKWLRG